MKIEFTGRQTDVPDDVRRLAERKLQKLGKLLPAVTRAHVILTADKHRQVALKKHYQPVYGARPMRRAIAREIEDQLSEELIKGSMKGVATVKVALEGEKLIFVPVEESVLLAVN